MIHPHICSNFHFRVEIALQNTRNCNVFSLIVHPTCIAVFQYKFMYFPLLVDFCKQFIYNWIVQVISDLDCFWWCI